MQKTKMSKKYIIDIPIYDILNDAKYCHMFEYNDKCSIIGENMKDDKSNSSAPVSVGLKRKFFTSDASKHSRNSRKSVIQTLLDV